MPERGNRSENIHVFLHNDQHPYTSACGRPRDKFWPISCEKRKMCITPSLKLLKAYM